MIYGYEFKKLIGMTKILLIYIGLIIVSVAIQAALLRSDHMLEGQAEVYYREYMEELGGEITPEKEEYMLSERERIQSALEKEEEMKNLYREGKISEQEYFDYNDERMYAKSRDESFTRVEGVYATIKENGGWFVYDTEWNKLFSTDIYGFLFVLFLTAVFSLYVGNEYSSGMWQYLDSSENGREKTIVAKCVAAVVTALVLSIIYFGLRYILFTFMGNIPLSNAPLCSISKFYHVNKSFSIGSFFIVATLLQGIAAATLVLIVMLFAYLARNGTVAMAIGLGMYFIPFLIKQYAGRIYSFSFCGAINISESIAILQGGKEHTAVLCLPVVLLTVSIIVMYAYRKSKMN